MHFVTYVYYFCVHSEKFFGLMSILSFPENLMWLLCLRILSTPDSNTHFSSDKVFHENHDTFHCETKALFETSKGLDKSRIYLHQTKLTGLVW